MTEEPTMCFEIYLTKEGQNELAKGQMIALMQLLRITNALRFHMSLLLHTKNEKDRLFQLRSQLEVYAILASSYEEAVKEFYNNLFKTLGPLSDDKELNDLLTQYGVKTKNYKDDEVLKVIDYIRNVFSFHMDPRLFKDYIVEAHAKEDMVIGIAKSEKIIDRCFLIAYNALIFQISRIAKDLTDQSKIIKWLFGSILHEVDYFCDLLEKFGGSILKNYGGKKLAKKGDILKTHNQ